MVLILPRKHPKGISLTCHTLRMRLIKSMIKLNLGMTSLGMTKIQTNSDNKLKANRNAHERVIKRGEKLITM